MNFVNCFRAYQYRLMRKTSSLGHIRHIIISRIMSSKHKAYPLDITVWYTFINENVCICQIQTRFYSVVQTGLVALKQQCIYTVKAHLFPLYQEDKGDVFMVKVNDTNKLGLSVLTFSTFGYRDIQIYLRWHRGDIRNT